MKPWFHMSITVEGRKSFCFGRIWYCFDSSSRSIIVLVLNERENVRGHVATRPPAPSAGWRTRFRGALLAAPAVDVPGDPKAQIPAPGASHRRLALRSPVRMRLARVVLKYSLSTCLEVEIVSRQAVRTCYLTYVRIVNKSLVVILLMYNIDDSVAESSRA